MQDLPSPSFTKSSMRLCASTCVMGTHVRTHARAHTHTHAHTHIPSREMGTFFPCTVSSIFRLSLTHTHTHTHTHTQAFFFCLYSSCLRACVTQCALVVVVILKCSTFLVVILEYSTVSIIFPLTSLLSSLYWPWDPLSSLESTPVSIKVPKQVD